MKMVYLVLIGLFLNFVGISKAEQIDITVKLSADEPYVIDIGTVEKDINRTIKVWLQNDMQNTVNIENVLVSCASCINPKHFPNEIKPLSTEMAIYQMDTTGRKGKFKIDSIIPVLVENERFNNLKLVFKGNVPSIWSSRSNIDLGNVSTMYKGSASIRLWQVGYSGVEVEEVMCNDEVLKCYFAATNLVESDDRKSLGDLRIETAVDQQTVMGAYEDEIIIIFNDSELPSIKIPVRAYILGQVKITPARVLLIAHKEEGLVVSNCNVVYNAKEGETYTQDDFKLKSKVAGLSGEIASYKKEKNGNHVINFEITYMPTHGTHDRKEELEILILAKDNVIGVIPCYILNLFLK